MKFFAYIIDPLKVIKTNKVDFFVLIVFTVVLGQIGIIANLILRSFLTTNTFQQSMYLESNSGSFYTFAAALVASCLTPIFTDFINNKKPKFSSIKVVTAVLAIIFLIFSGIIYSATQVKQLQPLSLSKFSIDWVQACVYIGGILFMVYAYCLMKIDSPGFDHLDSSFDEEDDARVRETMSESTVITDDGSGVAL